MSDRRVVTGVAVALIALHAALIWVGREPGLLTAQDDAVYILLGRALAHFSYVNLYDIALSPHTLYPPGYPALLLVWSTLFGESFHGLILLNALLSACALWVVFSATRRLFTPGLALLILLPLSVHPSLLMRAGSVRSETPFLAFSMLALYLLATRDPSDRRLLAANLLAIGAALIRVSGVPLVAATLVYTAYRRRYRTLAVSSLAATLTVGAWIGWTAFAAGSATRDQNYLLALLDDEPQGEVAAIQDPGPLQHLVRRLIRNGRRYAGPSLLVSFSAPTRAGTPVDNALSLLVIWAGLIAGLWQLWIRWRAAFMYLAAAAGLLMVWLYSGSRFLEPLIPLLVAGGVIGWAAHGRRISARWELGFAALFSAFLVAGALQLTIPGVSRRAACDTPLVLGADEPCLEPYRAAYLQAFAYIRDHIPREARFVAAKPEPLFYYTGNQSVGFSEAIWGTREQELVSLMERLDLSYVLLSIVRASERSRLLPRLEAACESLEVVQHFEPATYLFHRPPVPPENDACDALARYRAATADPTFGSPFVRRDG